MAGITYGEFMNIDEDLRFLSGHHQFYRRQQTVPKTVQEFVPQNQHELETTSVAKKDGSEADIEQAQKFAGVSVGIASLITESIISHPCIVIRRQCQGFGTLWKGAGSMFILRGLTLMTETVVSEFSPFPREINQFSSLKHIFQHLALKCITYTVLTPFYSASLVETVQSDIASEKPGVLDTLKEGLFRLTCWRKPRTNRLIPIWMLVGPSVLHGLLHYVVSSVVQSLSSWFINLNIQREKERLGIEEKDHIGVTHQCFSDLTAIFMGNFVSDIIVFPSETVLHRLFLQGTRTIIDNLDCGTSVMPVITRYEGPFDCIETILEEEGAAGLYKGFGALLLQYILHAAILKGTRVILDEVMFTVRKARKR
ncbi:mitochondrial outer membrane protein SLC25A46-like isoform X2 [Tachypleus tridentatus]|uniref:mitochondrial outer membrane protein SLC25A46-like isoform X2 n=1 Tax=Tachypleus tridentatus TaxID=6853 RepID=UPI003FD32656